MDTAIELALLALGVVTLLLALGRLIGVLTKRGDGATEPPLRRRALR